MVDDLRYGGRHRIGGRRLWRGDLESVAHEFAGLQVDDSALDSGTAHVHPESVPWIGGVDGDDDRSASFAGDAGRGDQRTWNRPLGCAAVVGRRWAKAIGDNGPVTTPPENDRT